jgi:hypothetical protein
LTLFYFKKLIKAVDLEVPIRTLGLTGTLSNMSETKVENIPTGDWFTRERAHLNSNSSTPRPNPSPESKSGSQEPEPIASARFVIKQGPSRDQRGERIPFDVDEALRLSKAYRSTVEEVSPGSEVSPDHPNLVPFPHREPSSRDIDKNEEHEHQTEGGPSYENSARQVPQNDPCPTPILSPRRELSLTPYEAYMRQHRGLFKFPVEVNLADTPSDILIRVAKFLISLLTFLWAIWYLGWCAWYCGYDVWGNPSGVYSVLASCVVFE